ncbi:MAG: xylulokinase [Planctomycetes bacterium]|nr:xylulokinase [Planctomycetota bacterium]
MAVKGELFLGLDVGTQGTKALLVDADKRAVVARASFAYGLIEGLPPGAAEQHPHTWIEAIVAVVGQVFRRREGAKRRLAAIAVSGQQHGCVLLDARGSVLRPAKLWCDTSTAAEARELSERLGRRVPAGFTASKVLWTKRREPELWRHVARVMLPHDYVNFALTGEHAAECGDASGTGWFDAEARAYDSFALDAIDARLCRCIAPLAAPDAIVGTVSIEAAERFGLPRGVPVACGSGDNMLSAFGAGAVEPGIGVLSLGTSATISAPSSSYIADPAGLVAPFSDATGQWLPLLCVMNATGVLEELRAAFGMDHARLTELARAVEPGARGVLFAPYLVGERVPDLPNARGVGLDGLAPGSFAPGVLYRAALEGVALNLAWGLERMRALGLELGTLRVAGGAAKNELWLEILANALDARIERLEEAETAALGAALQAAWAVRRARGEKSDPRGLARLLVRRKGEVLRPRAELVRTYRHARLRYTTLVSTRFNLPR